MHRIHNSPHRRIAASPHRRIAASPHRCHGPKHFWLIAQWRDARQAVTGIDYSNRQMHKSATKIVFAFLGVPQMHGKKRRRRSNLLSNVA